MHIERDGVALAPPASRKARAILGFLLLAPRPVGRQRLCELFFDIPDDPRASLRWNLTKLRAVTDEGDIKRVLATGDSLRFDPAGARIDVLDLMRGGADAPLPDGDGLFLEDSDLPDRPEFAAWLESAREDIRAATVRRISALADSAPAARDRLPLYRRLLALAPLDEAGNAGLVRTLTQLGRTDDAREAVAVAERAMGRAGLKPGPALRAALKPPGESPAGPEPAGRAPAAVAPLAPQLFDMLPGVAILPFHNYSPELVPEVLIDGFLESAIHMLARFRTFRVLSLNTMLAYRSRMTDPAALGEATGAHFIVGGSVMARGEHVKVRYRLVDAPSGALLASGDIDIKTTSGAVMLEDVPEALVVRLAQQLVERWRQRVDAMPEHARNALDHHLRGMGLAYDLTQPDYPAALEAFRSALALAPDFPAAMAGQAHCTALLRLARTEAERDEAVALANAAIARGADDAFALALAAWSLVQLAGDVPAALRAVDLAIRVNPLARVAWTVSAWIRAMNGEYETPMAHWDRAEACSPLGGIADQTFSGRSLCCWMAGRHADALAWARRSLERVPSNPGALTAGIAAAADLGDLAAARALGRALLQHYPEGADSPVIIAVPIVHREKRAAILAAMRRGLEMAAG